MTTLIIVLAVVFLILILAFTRPVRRDGLVPVGGRRIKNALAVAMVRSGGKSRPDWQTVENSDRRVPAPPGVEKSGYNDSFVFHGSDAAGNTLLTRLGFRDDGKYAEVWFWAALDGERYENPNQKVDLPADAEPSAVAAGGVSCTSKGDGSWAIAYRGVLAGQDSVADLTWTPESAMYCSADHMDPVGTGRAMAEMPWSRAYFDRIRSEKQVRIERGGRLVGTVTVGDRRFDLDMRGVRDHSWGRRDWAFINRHIWTMVSLEDDLMVGGRPYRYIGFTPANYGDSFRRLVTGWMAGPDDVAPIPFGSDMTEMGEDGTIPGEFTLRFRIPGSDVLTMKVERRQPEMPWIVQDGAYEVNEAWCGVTIEGVSGYGISEWGYASGRGYNRPFEKTGDGAGKASSSR